MWLGGLAEQFLDELQHKVVLKSGHAWRAKVVDDLKRSEHWCKRVEQRVRVVPAVELLHPHTFPT